VVCQSALYRWISSKRAGCGRRLADYRLRSCSGCPGYAAGLAAAGGESTFAANAETAIRPTRRPGNERLAILYGSQTGNGEEIAVALARQAGAQGFNVAALSLADYRPGSLKRESLVTFVISTHGEGEPPDDAELFHEFLLSEKAPQLSHLKYSVLALGDSSYMNFCQTGREFDTRLQQLGAQRFEALLECDLNYDDAAAGWAARIVAALPDLLVAAESEPVPMLRAVQPVSIFDRSNPFPAEILVNQKITGAASSKDVRHIELSLQGSGLSYEPGDSLGVIVENPPQLVAALLDELKLDGDAGVRVSNEPLRLEDAFTKSLEITALNLGFLRTWADASRTAGDAVLTNLLEANDADALADFLNNYQIIDVIRRYPARVDAEQFASMLRHLTARSYSIASSLDANPGEAHLTVAAVRYAAFGSEHWGAGSTHLSDRLAVGDAVSVFVERNSRFRLPATDVPVIMIGAGTGIAPFRAFVEQRIEQVATGDNWLFFGDRNADSDFLYQLEWQRHLKQGHLQRLDVAFSRDQTQKNLRAGSNSRTCRRAVPLDR